MKSYRMMRTNLLTAALFFLVLSVQAQISSIKPEKPSNGDVIIAEYNLSNPQSCLDSKEHIYVRVTNYLQNGAINRTNLLLHKQGNEMLGQFQLPEKTASFKVEFYTLNKDDYNASHTILVYDQDRKLPVQGAYLEAMFDDKPDSIFQKEIANYPTNYLAYAKYMNVLSMVKDPVSAELQIKDLLEKLTDVFAKEEKHTPGILAALCIGYAKTGDLVKGKKYMFELFNRFPLIPETAFAFNIYNYEYYKSSNKDVEDDVRNRLKEIFISYPDAQLSKHPNVFHYLQNDTTISVKAFEKVLLPMYNRNLVSYHAFTNLPEVYITHNQQLDSAESMLKDAIRQFQTGTINHQYRLNNNHYQMYVPLLLMDVVKINLLKKNYLDAIINSSAAIDILTGSNTEGNLLPLLLPLRASAYKQAGNFNLAMEDYKKLYVSGEVSVLDSMRNMFSICNIKEKTFDAYLTALKPTTNKSKTNKVQMAPDFNATDLEGNMVRLSDFKGKVVVINIWGIGCGPCIAEMPDLNKLVKKYSNNSNVVFLGITGDKTKDLIPFLKNRKYDYKILNNAKNIAESFNTNALPVHIVIGKQGEIISRSIGARADIKEYLQQVIDRNL